MTIRNLSLLINRTNKLDQRYNTDKRELPVVEAWGKEKGNPEQGRGLDGWAPQWDLGGRRDGEGAKQSAPTPCSWWSFDAQPRRASPDSARPGEPKTWGPTPSFSTPGLSNPAQVLYSLPVHLLPLASPARSHTEQDLLAARAPAVSAGRGLHSAMPRPGVSPGLLLLLF